MRENTIKQTQAKLAAAQPGHTFTDCFGNRVRRIEDTGVALGPGYNAIMPVAEYVDMLKNGYQWGNYLLPADPYQELGIDMRFYR